MSDQKPVSKSVKALRAFLQSPKGQARIAEYAAEVKAKIAGKRLFFESTEFNATYEKLLAATAEGCDIQSDNYDEPCETITNDELLNFAYSLDQRISDGHGDVTTVQELPVCPFSTHTVKYKDVLVQTTCGQGCFTRVNRATDTNHQPYPHNTEEVEAPFLGE